MNAQPYFRSRYANQVAPEGKAIWDIAIFESENFVAVPSLGSLVPGWLLIVPKVPVLAFGALPSESFAELEEFLHSTTTQLEAKFGSVCLFEHGAVKPASAVGCGVDHAHIHLVPTKFELLKTASQIAPEICWNKVDTIEATTSLVSRNVPYLYFQQNISSASYIGTASKLPSQLFRRAMAKHLNRDQDYDWKSDFGIENIEITLSALSADKIDANNLLLA